MSGPNGLSDRILILGDESKSARSIQRLLAAAGYDAISVLSFESAQQELAARDISIIIIETSASRLTDSYLLSADDDSGESLRRLHWAHLALDFCEEVRASETTADVPILVISKSHRAQDKVVCLNQGATDYITRPYQRAEQLNVLHTVSSVLASSLEPEVLMEGTLAAMMNYVRADSGVVFLREADERPMTVAAAEGLSLNEAANVSLLELYARIVPLINGKPLVLEPLPESARRVLIEDSFADIQGLACTQLVSKGKTLGAVCLFSKVGTPLLKHKTELLSTICNQLTIALENARFYLETKKSAAQLSFVYNLGHNLMTSLEMDELLSYAVFTVGKSLECDACAVIVRSSIDSTDLASAICSRSHGVQPEGNDWFHKERVVSYLTSADWRVQPAIQIRTAERFLHDPNVLLETVVPLMFDDRMLGILICGSFVPRPISPDDQKLLGAVAQQLSLAIRNTELYRRTKDTSINLAVEVSRRTREAEEQKRFTEKIIDSLPVSLYVVDRDMRIVAWNRNREVGDAGIKREEVLG